MVYRMRTAQAPLEGPGPAAPPPPRGGPPLAGGKSPSGEEGYNPAIPVRKPPYTNGMQAETKL